MGTQDDPTTKPDAGRRYAGDIAVVALSLYLLAFIAWVVVHAGSAESRALVSDWAFLPVGVVAAAVGWSAANHSGLDPRNRRAWRFLALAFLLNWVGDMTWLFLEVVLHVAPFPSVADAAYLAFYPVLLAGLLSFGVDANSHRDRLTLGLDTGIVLLGGFMVVWYLVLGPTVRASSSSGLAKVLSVAYPVGDLVLLFGIAVVVLRRADDASGRALTILVGAMALFLLADVSYGWLSLRDRYTGGDWPDAFWMAAPVVFAVAAQQQRRAAAIEWDTGRREQLGVRPISRLPYIAVAVSYALLLLVARGQAAYPLGGLLVGAVALTSLVVGRQVRALRENVQLMADFHHLAVTDSLTGLENRRHFFEVAETEFSRSRRTGRPLAALMIDIDHFKAINDAHGHATGDSVLTSVAAACRRELRGHDLLARYGGDELVALLPDTDLDAAMVTAARLRDATVAAGAQVPVTLSIGVATSEGCTDLPAVLQRADTALYAAKQSGRDCARAFVAPIPVSH